MDDSSLIEYQSQAKLPLAATHIPKKIAIELNCIGIKWINEETLAVAVPNNISEIEIKRVKEKIKKSAKKEIEVVLLKPEHIRILLAQNYVDQDASNELEKASNNTRSEKSVTDHVNSIINRAYHNRASDIHIEPTEKDVTVRIRVDGKLEKLTSLPIDMAAPVISRLKVLAKMNIVERRRPQDGQFSFDVDQRSIDLRLATVNTLYGEKVVIRILDGSRAVADVEELGISKSDLSLFHKMINSQFGLVIAAGPTGSGKTTTLHSAIRRLSTPEKNVTTLEDPVEYIVPGVNHIPVDESIGAGFATQLRAILRQDPDIVLVGETRDSETARIAIQGALSGRLVLTSLHAPDAVGVIYRLFQMEIEPHLVAASLTGVIAQRLVRKNCEYCKYEYSPKYSEVVALGLSNMETIRLTRGAGCTVCRGTGYFDRIGLFQLLEITDAMRELISLRPNPTVLYELAANTKMRSLGSSAIELVLEGFTTLEEINGFIDVK